MAKTPKNTGLIPHKDQYARMSFLFQASSTLSAQNHSLTPIAKAYSQTMNSIARKNVLRLSPHVKRQMCKSCYQILIPGLTCIVRISNHSKSQNEIHDILQISCHCGNTKRFPVGKNPHYVLWADHDDHN